MRRYFISILICGLIILASLLTLRYVLPETCKKFKEYAELSYVALKDGEIDEKSSDTLALQNLVAHAGGGIENLSYTNSLEALNLSYSKGFRFMELDFEWTNDGYLVLIHDWEESILRLFNARPRQYSLKEYEHLKMINEMTSLSLDDLAIWIRQHPDTFIITDVKRDNIRAL